MRRPFRSALTNLATPAAVAIALFTLGTVLAWGWWRDGTPVQVTTGGPMPLPCISYAPSQQAGHERDGLTEQRLRHDLALLSQRTRCGASAPRTSLLCVLPAWGRQVVVL